MQNVALITGASSGIGEAMARLHAARGGDLVLVARRLDRLNTLKAEIESEHGTRVLVIAEDLNEEAAPQRIHDRVTDEGIALSCLINNAGFALRGKFHEQDWTRNREMIQVNVVALSALTRAFLPGFVARGSGRILNVASTAALMPGPLQAVYFASKAFVQYFSNAIAEELVDSGVTVTTLLPGATASEFAQTSGMDGTPLFNRTTPAEEVARLGYDAMLRGDLDAFAGVTLRRRILMRIAPLFPKRYLLKSVRRMQEVPAA
ncbi:SDR family oxidoreductase [Pseudoruegeria sp. HB172150]|uniref:SDR family NAD(P)-dependent oxidoreductase n=1 Tax=Pseudoruegeria sp. HB172150 TaxID=2721164 RepID=UPI001555998B|nr:SDR family oxidoreductase [Pseudoruegeria sp. HB172150]